MSEDMLFNSLLSVVLPLLVTNGVDMCLQCSDVVRSSVCDIILRQTSVVISICGYLFKTKIYCLVRRL